MPPKNSRKNQSEPGLPPDFNLDQASFVMEKQIRNIQKLVKKEGVKSAEELNTFLNQYYKEGKAVEWTPETPLDKAQDLVYAAYEAVDRRERVKLAHQALAICPDCADAYVILAENAAGAETACPLYQEGVEAGERALGKQVFKDDVGEFWKIIETRPYMRARLGLAQCLWWQGKRGEAIQHYREMLRLNPVDNQGVRDLLLPALLETDKLAEAKKLMNQYKDEYSTFWLYTRALVTHLQNKESPQARKQLIKAFDLNPYVPLYFLGVKKLPRRPPPTFSPGHEDEALWYIANFGKSWFETQSVDWLAGVVSETLDNYIRLLDYRKTLKPLLRVFLEFSQAPKSSKKGPVPKPFLKAFETEDKPSTASTRETQIYTFKVGLQGLRGISRKIEIKGNQTLDDLHSAIYQAFDRDDEHLYAFFMSNKAWDNTTEYGPPSEETEGRDSTRTRIDSLDLQIKAKFLYLFDFGDEWKHPVTLLSIRKEIPEGKYPRIVERKGESPPQYPDYDEDADSE